MSPPAALPRSRSAASRFPCPPELARYYVWLCQRLGRDAVVPRDLHRARRGVARMRHRLRTGAPVVVMGMPSQVMPAYQPPSPMGMAVQISVEEQAHHAMLRERSYALALERGHIRR